MPQIDLLKDAGILRQAKQIADKMQIPKYANAAYNVTKIYEDFLNHAKKEFILNLRSHNNVIRAKCWLKIGEKMEEYSKFQKIYIEEVSNQYIEQVIKIQASGSSYEQIANFTVEYLQKQTQNHGVILTLFAKNKQIIVKELINAVLKDKYSKLISDDLNYIKAQKLLYLKTLVQTYARTKLMMFTQLKELQFFKENNSQLQKILQQIFQQLFLQRSEQYLDLQNNCFRQFIDKVNVGVYEKLEEIDKSNNLAERSIEISEVLQNYDHVEMKQLFSNSLARMLIIVKRSQRYIFDELSVCITFREQSIYTIGYIYLSKFDELLSSILKQLQRINQLSDKWDPNPHPSYFTSIYQLKSLVSTFSDGLSLALMHLKVEKALFFSFQNKRASVIAKLENSLKSLNQTIIDQIVDKIRDLFRGQKQTDFNFKKQIVGTAVASSQTCNQVIEFTLPFILAINNLGKDSMNHKRLIFHLGTKFYRLIHEHLLKFTYSKLGGVRLTQDLKKYEELLKILDDQESKDRFADLKLLLKVINVEHGDLILYIKEYLLKIYEKQTIDQVLHKRVDFKSAGISKMIKLI